MSLEIRNVVPYFSELLIVLNDGSIEATMYNQETEKPVQVVRPIKKGIGGVITGWMGDLVIYDDSFDFPEKPEAGKRSLKDVMDKATALGFDIETALNDAFDEVTETFTETKEQPPEMAKMGPKIILRPDAFICKLHPKNPMSITIKVGVYTAKKDGENWVPNKLKQNRYFAFEDTQTRMRRDVLLTQLEQSISSYEAQVAQFQSWITTKLANQPLPVETPEQYASMTIDQLKAQRDQADLQRKQAVASKREEEAIIKAPLSMLVPPQSGTPSSLQAKCFGVIKAIGLAVLETNKETKEDWAEIDPAAIMALAKPPEV